MITKTINYTLDDKQQVREQTIVYALFGIPIYSKKLFIPPKVIGVSLEYFVDF